MKNYSPVVVLAMDERLMESKAGSISLLTIEGNLPAAEQSDSCLAAAQLAEIAPRSCDFYQLLWDLSGSVLWRSLFFPRWGRSDGTEEPCARARRARHTHTQLQHHWLRFRDRSFALLHSKRVLSVCCRFAKGFVYLDRRYLSQRQVEQPVHHPSLDEH